MLALRRATAEIAGVAAGGQPACAAGEIQLCYTLTDCPSTATACVPFKWKVLDMGFCM